MSYRAPFVGSHTSTLLVLISFLAFVSAATHAQVSIKERVGIHPSAQATHTMDSWPFYWQYYVCAYSANPIDLPAEWEGRTINFHIYGRGTPVVSPKTLVDSTMQCTFSSLEFPGSSFSVVAGTECVSMEMWFQPVDLFEDVLVVMDLGDPSQSSEIAYHVVKEDAQPLQVWVGGVPQHGETINFAVLPPPCSRYAPSDITVNATLTQGQQYGKLRDESTGAFGTSLQGLRFGPGYLNGDLVYSMISLDFDADGSNPTDTATVAIHFTTNRSEIPDYDASILLYPPPPPPPCITFSIQPPEVGPGDTALISLKALNANGSISDFPPDQGFYIAIDKGEDAGTLLAEPDTGKELWGCQPFKFIDLPPVIMPMSELYLSLQALAS